MLSSKTVLVVGEDALVVFSSTGGKSKRLGALYWNEENLVERIVGLLLREGNKNPVQILYDMLEQQYKKEYVPNLSIFDRKSYVERKLRVAFPASPLKAALFLKKEAEENQVNKSNLQKDDLPYIFAGIPDVYEMQVIYDAILKAEVRFLGIGLLPVEGVELMKKLIEPDNKNDYYAKWTVLLCNHESGGLRQIVARNEELALTRLTAFSKNQNDPSKWADDASAEFKATLSYLLRFGFSQDQTMRVYIIHDDPSVAQKFKDNMDIDADVISNDVSEIAKKCGIKCDGSSDVFGDGLHAAWVSKKRHLKLPITSSKYGFLYRMHSNYSYATKAVMGVALLGLVYAGLQGNDIVQNSRLVDAERTNHAMLQRELSNLEESITLTDKDESYEYIADLLDAKDKIHNRGLKSFAMFDVIGRSLPRGVKLRNIEFEIVSEQENLLSGNMGFTDPTLMLDDSGEISDVSISQYQREEVPKSEYNIKLILSFEPDLIVEQAVQLTLEFQNNLQSRLEGYDISVSRQAANLSNTSTFTESLQADMSALDTGSSENSELDEFNLQMSDELEAVLEAEVIIRGEGQ